MHQARDLHRSLPSSRGEAAGRSSHDAGRDGQVVYAASKVREDNDGGCEDGFLAAADSTLSTMVHSIAKEVRLDLAPHRDQYAVRVREDRAGLSPADADRFRDAVRLSKRDQAAACRAFAAFGASAPDHGPTLFNRALCAEAEGRYIEAGHLYVRARVFGRGSGGAVGAGLDRAASLRAETEDVRRHCEANGVGYAEEAISTRELVRLVPGCALPDLQSGG